MIRDYFPGLGQAVGDEAKSHLAGAGHAGDPEPTMDDHVGSNENSARPKLAGR